MWSDKKQFPEYEIWTGGKKKKRKKIQIKNYHVIVLCINDVVVRDICNLTTDDFTATNMFVCHDRSDQILFRYQKKEGLNV